MENTTKGWINGFIGMSIFAGSLPATRVAVAELDPFFLTCARASLAGLLGMVALILYRQRGPETGDFISLALTAFGVVIGFPLLTALALQYITSAHSIIFVGLLPLSTAVFALLRGGERPRAAFWVFSLLGSLIVITYSAIQSDALSLKGDLLMLAAVLVCGMGYAEGARLARKLGGWQVISWALVLCLPVMLPLALLTFPEALGTISTAAWVSFAYVSIFSMLIGFIFWYRGLVLGGIAAVGQLQLLQPFIALGLAALFLHETVSWAMLAAASGAVFCVAGAKKFSA